MRAPRPRRWWSRTRRGSSRWIALRAGPSPVADLLRVERIERRGEAKAITSGPDHDPVRGKLAYREPDFRRIARGRDGEFRRRARVARCERPQDGEARAAHASGSDRVGCEARRSRHPAQRCNCAMRCSPSSTRFSCSSNGYRKPRRERLRRPAREEAGELGVVAVMQVEQALDRAGLGMLATAHDRVDRLRRVVGVLAVRVGERRGALVQRSDHQSDARHDHAAGEEPGRVHEVDRGRGAAHDDEHRPAVDDRRARRSSPPSGRSRAAPGFR